MNIAVILMVQSSVISLLDRLTISKKKGGIEMKQRKEYIINGKMYSVTDSLLLCVCQGSVFNKLSLYRTNKGAFFTIEENTPEGTKAQVISSIAAQKLLSENAAGIVNANYEKVFGKVKRG